MLELSRLTILNEVNRQEALLASCTMAPFYRVEDRLATEGDGPGSRAKWFSCLVAKHHDCCMA